MNFGKLRHFFNPHEIHEDQLMEFTAAQIAGIS